MTSENSFKKGDVEEFQLANVKSAYSGGGKPLRGYNFFFFSKREKEERYEKIPAGLWIDFKREFSKDPRLWKTDTGISAP